MNLVDVAEAAKANAYNWAVLPFYKNGAPFEGLAAKGSESQKRLASLKIPRPLWGMTLKAAGSMRFRWNETNSNRDQFFLGLCARFSKAGGTKSGGADKQIVPLELIHSKIVFDVKEAGDTFQKQGDGIITQNKNLIPVVTVADCVPIYFYDSKTGAFGVAHSGWKGTGIAAQAVAMMEKNYGSNPRDILAAIGPHIHDCCYLVDKERAQCFIDNFGSGCVQKVSQAQGAGGLFRLSLLRANLNVLTAAGVLEENIVAAKNCTACEELFGSFRREAAALDVPAQEKARLFTTQAAFVIMEGAEVNR